MFDARQWLPERDCRSGAEQSGGGLPQALRAPEEIGVAEELSVFRQVTVGVGVPPSAVGAAALGVGDGAAGDRRCMLGSAPRGPHLRLNVP